MKVTAKALEVGTRIMVKTGSTGNTYTSMMNTKGATVATVTGIEVQGSSYRITTDAGQCDSLSGHNKVYLAG